MSERTVYQSWAHVVSRRYRRPDGSVDDYDIFVAPRVVSILALTDDGRALMVRQFRPGVGEVLFELPGGGVEPDEDVAEAAGRELREETGFVPGELHRVGVSYQAANSTMVKHVFAATGCRRVGDVDLDHGEFLEPVLVTLGELRSFIREGRLTDQGPAYAALDHLGLL